MSFFDEIQADRKNPRKLTYWAHRPILTTTIILVIFFAVYFALPQDWGARSSWQDDGCTTIHVNRQAFHVCDDDGPIQIRIDEQGNPHITDYRR